METKNTPPENFDVADFAARHPVGFCRLPENFSALPTLGAPTAYCSPDRLDMRDCCGPAEDQGSNPWCAAYAATSWAESVLWRKSGKYAHLDPEAVYKWAKQHDGDPDGDGTTLVAVLDALLADKTFDPQVCRVRTIAPSAKMLRYAIHRFGTVLVGFDVSDEWYRCRDGIETDEDGNPVITGLAKRPLIGGHAIVACGYNDTGLVIQNSWGAAWGHYGFACIAWREVERAFMYGSVLDRCLDGFKA